MSRLTREQVYAMLLLRKRDNIFSVLPDELICYISDCDQDPNSEIAKALRLAVDGEEKALIELVAMLDKNPRLLLQAGNVVTRGGQEVVRVTLYEFFLGAGDPEAAKLIEPYFSKLEGGEGQKEKQLERYRPHIALLAKQLESEQPAYDLKPLIDIIKQSSAEDILAALNKDMTNKSALRDALIQFREAVKLPEKITVGMHYKHYTTLIQALNLLYDEWKKLSNNGTNYDKCRLVWRQIIGYLQRGLPAVDRFAFARAFDDGERTLNFKYDRGSFPDTPCGCVELTGVGVDEAIFGAIAVWAACVWAVGGGLAVRAAAGVLENTCRAKTSNLQNLCAHAQERKKPGV